MGEVELPVVDIDTSVADAFAALEAGKTAAVVVADGAQHRLVFGGALLRAQEANVATLRDVETQPLPDEHDDDGDGDDSDDGDGGQFRPLAGNAYVIAAASAERPSFSLRVVDGGKATVVTAHEYLAYSLARPDFFRCTIYPRHTFPDPPPDVDDGVVCPKCKRDPAIRVNGIVKLFTRV